MKFTSEQLHEKFRDGSILDEWRKPEFVQRFRAYPPYLTFSNPDNEWFIRSDGQEGDYLDDDTGALFDIGMAAFNRLPKSQSKKDFDIAFSSYFEFIESSRAELAALYSYPDVWRQKAITPVNGWDSVVHDRGPVVLEPEDACLALYRSGAAS